MMMSMSVEDYLHKQPVILAKNDLVSSRIFHVEGLHIEYSNGTQVQFERLVSSVHGAVLIAPIIDDEILLIREYAAGVERYELGFPKGKIDPGEGWQEASIRESEEEIGFKPQQVTLLDSVTLAAGYMTHQTHLVLATDLVPSEAEGDEPEPLEVVRWPLANWQSLLEHPEFTEGRAYAALMLLLKHFERI